MGPIQASTIDKNRQDRQRTVPEDTVASPVAISSRRTSIAPARAAGTTTAIDETVVWTPKAGTQPADSTSN
jgi:hypothetical protein